MKQRGHCRNEIIEVGYKQDHLGSEGHANEVGLFSKCDRKSMVGLAQVNRLLTFLKGFLWELCKELLGKGWYGERELKRREKTIEGMNRRHLAICG